MIAAEDILNKTQSIFRNLFDDEAIVLKRETTAKDIAEWDSLNHVSLIVMIEKEFKIKFNLAELQGLKNVGEMLDLIAKKTS